jgi:hypothetical protein
MIKVETPDFDRMYSLLTTEQKYKGFCFPGEEWKETQRLESRAIRIGPLEMLSPLDFVAQSFVRGEESYSSSIEVHSRDPSCFENLSLYFGKKLAQKGLILHPTTKDLTGYILHPKNPKNPLGVVASFNENFMRTISVGSLGAKKLELGDLNDFKIELGWLNIYANMLIDCVYDNHASNNIGLIIPNVSLNFFSI